MPKEEQKPSKWGTTITFTVVVVAVATFISSFFGAQPDAAEDPAADPTEAEPASHGHPTASTTPSSTTTLPPDQQRRRMTDHVNRHWDNGRCELDITVIDIMTGEPVIGTAVSVLWQAPRRSNRPGELFTYPFTLGESGQVTVAVGCYESTDVGIERLPDGYSDVRGGVWVEFQPDETVRSVTLLATSGGLRQHNVMAVVYDITSGEFVEYQGATVTFDWGSRRLYDADTRQFRVMPHVHDRQTNSMGQAIAGGYYRNEVTVTLNKPEGYEIAGARSYKIDYRPLPNSANRVGRPWETVLFTIHKPNARIDDNGGHLGEDPARSEAEQPGSAPATTTTTTTTTPSTVPEPAPGKPGPAFRAGPIGGEDPTQRSGPVPQPEERLQEPRGLPAEDAVRRGSPGDDGLRREGG